MNRLILVEHSDLLDPAEFTINTGGQYETSPSTQRHLLGIATEAIEHAVEDELEVQDVHGGFASPPLHAAIMSVEPESPESSRSVVINGVEYSPTRVVVCAGLGIAEFGDPGDVPAVIIELKTVRSEEYTTKRQKYAHLLFGWGEGRQGYGDDEINGDTVTLVVTDKLYTDI